MLRISPETTHIESFDLSAELIGPPYTGKHAPELVGLLAERATGGLVWRLGYRNNFPIPTGKNISTHGAIELQTLKDSDYRLPKFIIADKGPFICTARYLDHTPLMPDVPLNQFSFILRLKLPVERLTDQEAHFAFEFFGKLACASSVHIGQVQPSVVNQRNRTSCSIFQAMPDGSTASFYLDN